MFSQLRFFLRFLSTFLARFKWVLLAGILAGSLLFVLFFYVLPRVIYKKSERIGIVGRFTTENLPASILNMIGGGLTKISEDGLALPDLASSWESQNNGKNWIFHLKEDAKWQDGSPVTAKTINYEFSDLKIEKPDSKTIVFLLEGTYYPFPVVLSKPVFKKGLLGTGQWRVKKATLVGGLFEKMILVNILKRERKIYKFYPTEDTAKMAFKLGHVDYLEDIYNPDPFASWRATKIEADYNPNRTVAVFLNTQDKLLSEKSLRQALSYSLEKEKFNGPRSLGPISPFSWAYNPQIKPYFYDLLRAKELLDELPGEQRDNLSIKLSTTAPLLSVAEEIAKDWDKIGVKTQIQVSPQIPNDYQALLVIFDAPKDPDQYTIWHSTQEATNISRYKNPRIDKLLEEGRLKEDREERKKIYLDFQRFLVEDSPAIFLYHPTYYTISRK